MKNLFVPHCVKVHMLIKFPYTGLAKTSKKILGTIPFVLIIVVIRNRRESRTMNGSYEAACDAVVSSGSYGPLTRSCTPQV